jgi:hypothetical protein
MTDYDRLLGRALDALTADLPGKGFSAGETAEVVSAVRRSNFPALLGLLATSEQKSGVLGQPLIHEAAVKAAGTESVKATHLGADDVERVLTAVFVHGASPQTLLADPSARSIALSAALQELGKRSGIPITPEEAETLLTLLSTGKFYGDIGSALAAVVYAVRGIPIGLVKDVSTLPQHFGPLLIAIAKDLTGTPFTALIVVNDLMADGRLDHPPAVLTNTMACLLGFATLATTARMISDLIAPDNRTVRLAIVIYARVHGVPVEEADLDLLRDNVFSTGSPDLGPVLVAAVERYLGHSGKAELLAALRQIAAASS